MSHTEESRKYLAVGAIISGIGVALGAFGAHGLKTRVDAASMAVYQTGVQYQLVHGLALIAIASSRDIITAARLKLIARLWTIGIILFCGSLYLLAVTGVKILGAITPLGGVCFLTGWLILASSALKCARNTPPT